MLVGSAYLQESLGNSRKQGFGIGRLEGTIADGGRVAPQRFRAGVRTVETQGRRIVAQ